MSAISEVCRPKAIGRIDILSKLGFLHHSNRLHETHLLRKLYNPHLKNEGARGGKGFFQDVSFGETMAGGRIHRISRAKRRKWVLSFVTWEKIKHSYQGKKTLW